MGSELHDVSTENAVYFRTKHPNHSWQSDDYEVVIIHIFLA